MKELDLTMLKMAQGGRALARLPDGRVCFVAGALTGETARVRILKEKKDFAEGAAVEISAPNAERVRPQCPFYGRCGGCSLQHASLKFQEQSAREVARELFRRFAKEELPESFRTHFGEPFGYRCRARFVRSGNAWGFRSEGSHSVTPVDACPVLSAGLADVLARGADQFPRVQELSAFDNGEGRVSFFYKGMSAAEFREKAGNEVRLEGKTLSMDASVFFQSNLGLLPELVRTVRAAAGEGKLLIDLFSGVGFFAAFLEDHFERVITVERDEGCLRHARRNLSPRAESVGAPAEIWLAEHDARSADVLIVDPPRTGIPPGALAALCRTDIPKILYVSCDPVTLARDFASFKKAGYGIRDAHGFGFYPQTPHFEMFLELCKD